MMEVATSTHPEVATGGFRSRGRGFQDQLDRSLKDLPRLGREVDAYAQSITGSREGHEQRPTFDVRESGSTVDDPLDADVDEIAGERLPGLPSGPMGIGDRLHRPRSPPG